MTAFVGGVSGSRGQFFNENPFRRGLRLGSIYPKLNPLQTWAWVREASAGNCRGLRTSREHWRACEDLGQLANQEAGIVELEMTPRLIAGLEPICLARLSSSPALSLNYCLPPRACVRVGAVVHLGALCTDRGSRLGCCAMTMHASQCSCFAFPPE
jgi:hypothetical protein